MSRQTKLDDEVQKKICDALKLGNFRQTAAKAAGISLRTFTHWMKLGKDRNNKPFLAFRRAVLEAETMAEMRAVGLIVQKAAEDPKHAQWWLTHRWPERWAEKTRLRMEHTGKAGGPIEVTDARDKLFEKLASALTGKDDTEEADEGNSEPQ